MDRNAVGLVSTRILTGRQLRQGDRFTGGALIVNEPDLGVNGIWLRTNDGRTGYVLPNARFNIHRESD